MQCSAVQCTAVEWKLLCCAVAAVLVLAETLKKLLLFRPENPAPKIVSPDSGAWRTLAGHGGVKLGLDHWTLCQNESGLVIWTPTEVGCGLMRL